MTKNKRRNAFSLTELLIVLVIIAILFAAMAPIMSKRRNGMSTAVEPVWVFVANDEQKDAYYDPGAKALTSTAMIGVHPKDLTNNFKPYSKVLIKAKENQDLIQFRQGSGNGTFVGKFSMNDEKSTYLSSRLGGHKDNNFAVDGANNSIMGVGAFSKVSNSDNNTAMGFNAMLGHTDDSPADGASIGTGNVAVGISAGQYMPGTSEYNVFLGANAGKNRDYAIDRTVAVGVNVLGLDESAGSENVFLGYHVASVGMSRGADPSVTPYGNVVVGSNYYGISPKFNTIIGYNTYSAGSSHHYDTNTTVVGAYACDSMLQTNNYTISTNRPYRTCIGYSSAQNSEKWGSVTNKNYFENDKYDRVFIGGSPKGFGGRSVLEVHNVDTTTGHSAYPNIGPTVVLNSNLVVRGNIYFPDVTSGKVKGITKGPYIKEEGSEQNRDFCSKGCCVRIFRRWKCSDWRKDRGCNILEVFFDVILTPITTAMNLIVKVFTPIGSIFDISWKPLNWFTEDVFGADTSGKKRVKDPHSMSVLILSSEDGLSCDGGSISGQCPQLKTSDIRLKENIVANSDAMAIVDKIQPYKYTFKNDKLAIPQVGVMAQDLQAYSPNSVSTDKDGYLSIRWDEMFYAAINSVKYLDDRTSYILSQLVDLEKMTEKVAASQKSTQDRIDNINRRINNLEK